LRWYRNSTRVFSTDYRNDRECIVTFPFPPIPSNAFPFIPIPIFQFKSYFHFYDIPIRLFTFPSHSKNTHRTRKCKCKQSTVEQQKNSSAENWASIVEKQHSQYSENQTKIFLRTFFKMLCTLWWNGKTVNKYLGIFFLIGLGVIHIPIYLNCHSFPFPFLSWYLFPFLWYSREIPIASPILAVISITDAARIVCGQHIRVTVGWRLSVRPSVPSIDSSSGARRVYC